MITRFRFEANGPTDNDVHDQLLEAVTSTQSLLGGQWVIEHEVVFTAKTGWWGYMTIRRHGEAHREIGN